MDSFFIVLSFLSIVVAFASIIVDRENIKQEEKDIHDSIWKPGEEELDKLVALGLLSRSEARTILARYKQDRWNDF